MRRYTDTTHIRHPVLRFDFLLTIHLRPMSRLINLQLKDPSAKRSASGSARKGPLKHASPARSAVWDTVAPSAPSYATSPVLSASAPSNQERLLLETQPYEGFWTEHYTPPADLVIGDGEAWSSSDIESDLEAAVALNSTPVVAVPSHGSHGYAQRESLSKPLVTTGRDTYRADNVFNGGGGEEGEQPLLVRCLAQEEWAGVTEALRADDVGVWTMVDYSSDGDTKEAVPHPPHPTGSGHVYTMGKPALRTSASDPLLRTSGSAFSLNQPTPRSPMATPTSLHSIFENEPMKESYPGHNSLPPYPRRVSSPGLGVGRPNSANNHGPDSDRPPGLTRSSGVAGSGIDFTHVTNAHLVVSRGQLALVWRTVSPSEQGHQEDKIAGETVHVGYGSWSIGKRGLTCILVGDFTYKSLLCALGLRDDLLSALGLRLPILVIFTAYTSTLFGAYINIFQPVTILSLFQQPC